MRAFLALLSLFALAGCATSSTLPQHQGSLVVAEPPDGHCKALGPMAFKGYSGVLMSEDALLATAVVELQRRAAYLGATHLVVEPPGFRRPSPTGTSPGRPGRRTAATTTCADGGGTPPQRTRKSRSCRSAKKWYPSASRWAGSSSIMNTS